MRHSLSIAAVLLAVAGCAVGPDYRRPQVTGADGPWIASQATAPADLEWWRALGDPVLTQLIEDAGRRNLDVREAEARLREARAQRDAAAGRALPQAEAVASASRAEVSQNGQLPVARIPGFQRRYSLFDAGFDASWEIDLWGGSRRTVEAASARAEAADQARRAVVISTVGEVVRSYAELRGAQARLASALAQSQARAQIARLSDQRFRAGESSRLDAARAQAQARNAAAAAPAIAAEVNAAAYRLALLTGRAPEALLARLSAPAPVPALPSVALVGLRSDLLRRRPDVMRAERELAAATADIGAATAELFPKLSLMAAAGQQSRRSGDLASPDSTRYQIGPSLRWPIFSGGRIRAQIRAADARADAAAALYEKAVLSALADSETALNRYAAAGQVRAERRAALNQTAAAFDLARQRYSAGEDDMTAMLDAQAALSEAERLAIEAQVAELEALAALNKALGGGWERGSAGV